IFRAASITVALLFFPATTPSTAVAAITSIDVVHVPQSVVPGHQTYDILVNATGQFLCIDMRIDLTAGSLYDHGLGSHAPPDDTFFPAAPALPFDTFVGMGGRTS